MQKAEAQHNHAQNQPTQRQGRGASLESPQGEQIAQLEAMTEASPQAGKLAQLEARANNSPQATAQRRMMGIIHNSPGMAAQRKAISAILAGITGSTGGKVVQGMGKQVEYGEAEESSVQFNKHDKARMVNFRMREQIIQDGNKWKVLNFEGYEICEMKLDVNQVKGESNARVLDNIYAGKGSGRGGALIFLTLAYSDFGQYDFVYGAQSTNFGSSNLWSKVGIGKVKAWRSDVKNNALYEAVIKGWEAL